MKAPFIDSLRSVHRYGPAWLLIIFTLLARLAVSQSVIPVTYSTQSTPAGEVAQNADAVVYVLEVSASGNFVRLQGLTIKTTGTYTDADVSQFTLSSINSDGSGYYDWGTSIGAPTGNGETLTWNFGGEGNQFPQVLPHLTTYFTITAKTKISAIPGRTVGINGASNALNINYYNPEPEPPTPVITNDQQDIAGLQTITGPYAICTTMPLPATNIMTWINGQRLLFYILKVETNTRVDPTKISLKTTGTYDNIDISMFEVAISRSPSYSDRYFSTSFTSINGSGETIDFTFPQTTLEANATNYFLFTARVTNNVTNGRSFGVNGADNELNLEFAEPNITVFDNQTDVSELQTVRGPYATYTTESLASENVGKGSTDQLIYVLKVAAGDTGPVSFDNLAIKTIGTYASSDISQFKLWKSNTPSLTGASPVSTDGSVAGNGEKLSFSGSQTIGRNSSAYFLVTADVSADAVTGRTVGINGTENNLDITYTDAKTFFTDSQTDAAALRTIISSAVTYETESLSAGNVERGATDHPLYILKVTTGSTGTASFSSFNIKTDGSYTSADISQFKLWRSDTPGLAGSSLVGTDATVTGQGETLSFAGSQTLEADATTYFIITADVKPDAKAGRIFGINGSNNALSITYGSTPDITDSQTNLAGYQTIAGPMVTYTTESLAAGNVSQGAVDHPLYILKIVVNDIESVSFSSLNVTTQGTYTSSDISQFRIWQNSTPNLTGASVVGADRSVSGHGEALSFSLGTPAVLEAGSTTYFLITADVRFGAAPGRTFGINGADKTLAITYSETPLVTDSQDDKADLQTVVSTAVTYTTEPLSAGNAIGGATDHPLYLLKVVTSETGSVSFDNLSVVTSGTYTDADISRFRLWRNDTPGMTGASTIGTDGSVSGHGETLSFSLEAPAVLAAGSTTYFLVTADVTPKAANGRTFGINGAENTLHLTYGSQTGITNNQSDVASLQTIVQPTVTYTTESLAEGNTSRGATDYLVYVLKVVANDIAPVSFNNLNINTSGSYTSADITQFKLWRNSTPALAGAGSIGLDGTITGHGETLSFAPPQPVVLEAGSTTYFLLTADIALAATDSRTFGINGSEKSLAITYTNNPNISDNQNDAADLQTIVAPSVTYSTEPISAASVPKGATKRFVYVLKIVTGISGVMFDNFTIKTTGTYSSSDISQFRLWSNDSPEFTLVSPLVATVGSVNGAGETLSFTGIHTLPAHATRYFGITADVAESATAGKTFGIDGANNAFSVSYSGVPPSIINSQTDVAGLHTIGVPLVTYSTEALPAGNSFPSANDDVVYILKVTTSDAGPANISQLNLRTVGTYTGADIGQFKLWKNSTASIAGATRVAADESVTGSSETLSFSGSETLPAKATTYLLVTANVKPEATVGRTYGINGADNALDITYDDPIPPVTENQTDVAGLRTIQNRTVTYSTEHLVAQNVAKGENNRTIYILKVVTGNVGAVKMNNLTLKTTGTYTSSDLGPFELRKTNALNGSWTTVSQVNPSAAGTGETLSFPLATSLTLEAGSTTYLAIVTNVKAEATNGRTFGINGSGNELVINYPESPPPVVTNNQTNAAGLLTIGAATIALSSETIPAADARQGAIDHPVLTVKVVMGNVGATLTQLSARTTGNYGAGDISSFNLYHGPAPDVNGQITDQDVLITTYSPSVGSGEFVTFSVPELSFPAGSTTYLKIRANISPTANVNRIFYINGANPYPAFVFSGIDASITNNLSNSTGEQTIRPANACFSGLIVGESHVCTNSGFRTTYSNPTAGNNGRWSSLDESIIWIRDETGEAEPRAAGTTKIRYTIPSDCDASGFVYSEKEVKVTSAGKIEIGPHVCLEENKQLPLTLVGADPGGVWSSGTESVAVISGGGTSVTLLSAGYTTIGYSVTSGGCTSTTSAALHVTDPAKLEIDIPDSICVRANDKPGALPHPFLTEGVWRIAPFENGSMPDFAAIDPSTSVMTITGSGVITLEYEASVPCVYKLSKSVTINYLYPIVGPELILANTEEDWLKKYEYTTGNPEGGNWTSSNPFIASIDQDGKLTLLNRGYTELSYRVNNAYCGEQTITKLVFIESTGIMSGPSEICSVGSGPYQYTVANITPGGTWTVSNGIGLVDRNGLFYPYFPGEAIITYTPPFTNLSVSQRVKVLSTGDIEGPRNLCLSGEKFRYERYNSSSDDGEWASSNPSVATVDQTGEVSPLTVGTTIITYSINSATCGKITVSRILNISEPATGVQFVDNYQVIVEGTNPLIYNCAPIGTINSPALASASAPRIRVTPDWMGIATIYRLEPYRSSPDATSNYPADLVLYFYQEDFDLFNKSGLVKLPTGPADLQGIANVRIRHSASGNHPEETIKPEKVTWNADKMRWEVEFSTTHFSSFSLSAEETILPVTLISFNASGQEQQVALHWATSMETNSEAFEVQHSSDGRQWQLLGTVKALGESQSVKNYTYLHQNPLKGLNYYRLKMIDADQSFTYSRIQSLQVDQAPDVRIFPNPVSERFTIETSDWKNVRFVKIYNLNGVAVYESDRTRLSSSVDVKSLGAGVYIVELLFSNGQTKTSRIVVAK